MGRSINTTAGQDIENGMTWSTIIDHKDPNTFLELYSLQHLYAYSPHCSLYIFQGANKENLVNNQGVLKLVIISCILMTFNFDSGAMGREKLDASHS